MYIGVNGLFFVRRGKFGLMNLMSWGFKYVGVIDLYFVRRRREIWVTGCNVVGFLCTSV